MILIKRIWWFRVFTIWNLSRFFWVIKIWRFRFHIMASRWTSFVNKRSKWNIKLSFLFLKIGNFICKFIYFIFYSALIHIELFSINTLSFFLNKTLQATSWSNIFTEALFMKGIICFGVVKSVVKLMKFLIVWIFHI